MPRDLHDTKTCRNRYVGRHAEGTASVASWHTAALSDCYGNPLRKLFASNVGGHDHPLRGIVCHSVALLLFACLDATAKYLSALYPVPLIVWVRYAVQFALMTAILAPMMGRNLLKTNRTGLVIVRSSCLVIL